MSFTPIQKQELEAPLHSSAVRTRQQAGRSLSYLEGWHVIAEANRIFGFEGWDRETVDLRQLGEPREIDGKYRIAYMAKVRVTVRADGRATLIIRDGCGYGSGIDKDLGSAHESALKEAETDAMKRAFMTFGNPFGLALYDKEQRNVVDDSVAIYQLIEEAFKTAPTLAHLHEAAERHKGAIGSLTLDQAAKLRNLYAVRHREIGMQQSEAA